MKRTDDLGINGLRLIQDSDLFCFGTDSVLLSDFARAPSGSKVVDLCSGNGIIPVLLSAKTKAASIVGVELLRKSWELAEENVRINSLEDRVSFINDDLKNWKNHFASGSIDVVTCNPPYMKVGAGFRNPHDLKAAARHELFATLHDIISVAAGMLRFGGKFYIVHRADRLCDVLCEMRLSKLEPKRIAFVHPEPGKAPVLILVEGMLGAKPSLKTEAPIYVNV